MSAPQGRATDACPHTPTANSGTARASLHTPAGCPTTKVAPRSTKLLVTCAANRPDSERKLKVSTAPATNASRMAWYLIGSHATPGSASVSPDRFDALLPGGVANPDALRVDQKAVAFVKHFVDAKKPIAAICHGPWTLIEAGGVKGHTMTSWPSLQTDLRNAGAKWEDRKVVVDGRLVTSRKPDDLPDFCREMLSLFGGAERRAA